MIIRTGEVKAIWDNAALSAIRCYEMRDCRAYHVPINLLIDISIKSKRPPGNDCPFYATDCVAVNGNFFQAFTFD